jgi:hypothetical protein
VPLEQRMSVISSPVVLTFWVLKRKGTMSASQLTAEEDRWTEEFVAACKEKGFALKSRFEVGPQMVASSCRDPLLSTDGLLL